MSIMNKRLTCYLAGAMSSLSYEEMNEWREYMRRTLHDLAHFKGIELNVINPVDFYNFKEQRYKTQREVRDFDLSLVTKCDFIIVNLHNINQSIGTAIEMHECYYHNRIPVYAFGTQEEYDNAHPWVKENISRYEDDGLGIIRYINEFWFV